MQFSQSMWCLFWGVFTCCFKESQVQSFCIPVKVTLLKKEFSSMRPAVAWTQRGKRILSLANVWQYKLNKMDFTHTVVQGAATVGSLSFYCYMFHFWISAFIFSSGFMLCWIQGVEKDKWKTKTCPERRSGIRSSMSHNMGSSHITDPQRTSCHTIKEQRLWLKLVVLNSYIFISILLCHGKKNACTHAFRARIPHR